METLEQNQTCALTGEASTRRVSALFNAKSVAVVGASPNNPYTRNVIPRILASSGMRLHLVNPNRDFLGGRRCHADIRDIDEVVDLAFVAAPAPSVLEVLKASYKQGVRAAIVVSAGFSESGDDNGEALSQALTSFADETGMAICGPSCLGLANNEADTDLFATGLAGKIPKGHIALISQSGGTVSGMIKSAIVRHLGFSHVISSGSELCTNTCDYLEYLLQSPATNVICFFLEQLSEPERFLNLCRQAAARHIALLCIKIGRSEPGRRAALGHTGSITGQDSYFEALFKEAGVIRCSSVEEMLDAAALLAQTSPEFWPAGKRLGIVTVSGGTGTLLADLAAENGLEIPPLSDHTRNAIQVTLPPRVRIGNPVDIAAQLRGRDRNIWNNALEETAKAGEFDSILVSDLHPYSASDVHLLDVIRRKTGRPILLSTTTDGVEILDDCALAEAKALALPVALGAHAAIKGIVGATRQVELHRAVVAKPEDWWSMGSEGAATARIFAEDHGNDCATRNEVEWRKIFSAAGLQCPQEVIVQNGREAEEAIARFTPPFAVKGLSPGVQHKAELGLVSLNNDSKTEVAATTDAMLAHARKQNLPMVGCIIQEMVSGPVCELYISSLAERGGRPIITVGLGGGDVESNKAFSRRLAPVSLLTAKEMIAHVVGTDDMRLFAMAAKSVVRLSEIAVAFRKHIDLFEINPLMVCQDGSCWIVDTVAITSGGVGGE